MTAPEPPVTADHTPERLSAEDRAHLRGVAEAATPGPWTADAMGSEGYHIHGGSQRVGAHNRRLRLARCGFESWDTDRANAEHIAAFDPPTVLALLDLAAHLADVEARQTAVEAEHRVIHQAGAELVCFCGAHLSVYGLTRSLASVFAQHVRDARALHPDPSEVARDE